jgi:hypothetical protein
VDISASHERAGLGETVVVPITIENLGDTTLEENQIVGISLTVTYDSTLLSVIKDGEFTISATLGGGAPANWFIEQNEIAPGQLELAMAADFDTPLDTDGELLTVAFVATSTLATTSAVSPVGLTAQFNEGAISATTTDGSVTVSAIEISEVVVSNVRDTQVTITWITDALSDSAVDYGLSPGVSEVVADATDVFIHVVTLTGLTAATAYDFVASSSGATDPKDGSYRTFTTATDANSGASHILNGAVVDEEGAPLIGALVWLSVSGSQALSAITDATGVWTVDLALLRDPTGAVQTFANGDIVSTSCRAAFDFGDGTGEILFANDTYTLAAVGTGSETLPDCSVAVEICYTYILAAGLNGLAFPFEQVTENDGTPYTAKTLLQDIANAVKIYRVEPGIGFESGFFIPGTTIFKGVDFPILPGAGYILQLTGDATLEVCGRPITSALSVDIAQGMNGIGIPYPEDFYTGKPLLTSVPNAQKIYRIEAGVGFESVFFIPGTTIVKGTDFDVVPTEAYLVLASDAGTFVSGSSPLTAPVGPPPDSTTGHGWPASRPKASNISARSARVSWIGSNDVLSVGPSPDLLKYAAFSDGYSHVVTLRDLSPDTTYFFAVANQHGSFRTEPSPPTKLDFHTLAGRVRLLDGAPTPDGTLVYVQGMSGSLVSRTQYGYWGVDLVNLPEPWVVGDALTIQVVGPNSASATAHVQDGDMQLVDEIELQARSVGTDAAPAWRNLLLANYPNPFNPETWIPFELSQAADTTILIHDSRGMLVRRLDLGYMVAGQYATKDTAPYWDGRNDRGEPVASGLYFYTLRAGNYAAGRRMILLR